MCNVVHWYIINELQNDVLNEINGFHLYVIERCPSLCYFVFQNIETVNVHVHTVLQTIYLIYCCLCFNIPHTATIISHFIWCSVLEAWVWCCTGAKLAVIPFTWQRTDQQVNGNHYVAPSGYINSKVRLFVCLCPHSPHCAGLHLIKLSIQ